MAAQTLRGSEGPGIGDVPVGLVVELEAPAPVPGLQDTRSGGNRVPSTSSGTSRLTIRAEQKNRPYHPPCSTALVSDEHEPRDSVNSPTAFALNSGVHPAPFAMAPSSPIEPGEIRNKTVHITSPWSTPQLSRRRTANQLLEYWLTCLRRHYFRPSKTLSLARAQDKNLVTMYHSKEVEA